MVHDYMEISSKLEINLNPQAQGFISFAIHLETLTMDIEANHFNGYVQVGHVQVSAPETYEALPLNDTLHGGKNPSYLVLIFFQLLTYPSLQL